MFRLFSFFCLNSFLQFANMVQGKNLPVRVNLFLIVNPQPWFHKVWAIVRPMLSDEFASKVFMIPESQLSEHLRDGYEQFLPDEMATSSGSTNTKQVVTDYIDYRIFLETGRVPMRLSTITTTESPKPSELKKTLTMESSSSQQSSPTKVAGVVASPPCNLRRMFWFKKKPVALQT